MMGYRTYRGKDIAEAMAKMKLDLGTDAIILHKREIKPKGIFALFKKPEIEIIGAVSERGAIRRNPLFASSTHKEMVMPEKHKVDISALIQKELSEIKKQIEKLTGKKGEISTEIRTDEEKFKGFRKFVNIMRENDIGDDIIEKIVESIEKEIDVTIIDDERVIKEKIKHRLMDLIDTTGPIELTGKNPKVFMLVGPTGMGKTTTLVKIAANYRLKKNKEIEIISIDNYRIGAFEQLKAYAEIMQIPFRKVTSKSELKSIVKKSNADLILIDTAGRSPQDDMSISMLRDYIKELNLHYVDIFLVVSANVKKKDIVEISKKYSKTNYKYLLYTKLDETLSTGAIIDATYRIKRPISFITFGQDVPKHIDIATPEYIVNSALVEF